MITKSKAEEKTLVIIEKLKDEKYEEINEIFEKERPYDMSIIFQSLPEKHRASMLHYLEESTIASLLQKLNPMHQLEILSKIGPEKSNKVLALLDTRILSKLLRKYPKADLQAYLEEIEVRRATYIKKVINSPVDSAGGLMTNRYVSIRDTLTVKQAIDKMRELALYSESINHLYLVDDSGKLTGAISYRDLILADHNEVLEKIMLNQVICITVTTKRAEIVRLLQRYDFTALPSYYRGRNPCWNHHI